MLIKSITVLKQRHKHEFRKLQNMEQIYIKTSLKNI